MSQSPDPSGAIFGGLFLLWGLIIVVALAFTVFWIVELIDVARREFTDPNAKVIWILMIVFLHGLGALLYYFIGKNQGTLPGQGVYPPQNTNPSGGQWPPPPGSNY